MILIDIITLILIVFFGIKGYNKGFLYTTARFIGGVVAIIIATHFSSFIAQKIFQFDNQYLKMLYPTLGFIIILIACFLIFNVVLRILLKPIKESQLSGINKLLGALVYMLFFSVLIGSLLWFFSSLGILNEDTLKDSYISRYLIPFMPAVFDIIGQVFPIIKQSFQDLNLYFENLSHQVK